MIFKVKGCHNKAEFCMHVIADTCSWKKEKQKTRFLGEKRFHVSKVWQTNMYGLLSDVVDPYEFYHNVRKYLSG